MDLFKVTDQRIEYDTLSKKLSIVRGWTTEELERIFTLGNEDVPVAHKSKEDEEPLGPNYFLMGGPNPAYCYRNESMINDNFKYYGGI